LTWVAGGETRNILSLALSYKIQPEKGKPSGTKGWIKTITNEITKMAALILTCVFVVLLKIKLYINNENLKLTLWTELYIYNYIVQFQE